MVRVRYTVSLVFYLLKCLRGLSKGAISFYPARLSLFTTFIYQIAPSGLNSIQDLFFVCILFFLFFFFCSFLFFFIYFNPKPAFEHVLLKYHTIECDQ
ncbi:hypothetical protein BDV29DRAFT_116037 [Aspergillus leporis]|uniref:Uncharacterized protein n=1 Tax=Aspergillus leporis TaxID=41062 RepID=A0A5N5X218_9EURO|nr:hypothetical protein BDV29DRAFT_116037 [Aspergillus leporis]